MIPDDNGATIGSRWQSWWKGLNWEETRAGVDRESRARVLLLGLAGAGKSTLFNRLCGWTISPPVETRPAPAAVEDFGLFCLVDLPEGEREGDREMFYGYTNPQFASPAAGNGPGAAAGAGLADGTDPVLLAEGADLLVYVLDGAVGVRAADYRWVGRLRRLGLPLVVVLNKCDLTQEPALAGRVTEIEQRLASPVLPISALNGANIPTSLLPRMIDACPSLAVALGRELGSFRREAAGRLIGRAAFLNSLIALEPAPLVDLPLQMMTLSGLFLRIAALYNRPPTTHHRREIVAALAGSLATRYAAQQALKLVPVVGWLASSLIGLSTTWLLGQAAVIYFESGGETAVVKRVMETKGRMSDRRRRITTWLKSRSRRLARRRR